MAVLKYHDGTDWEPVVSALQGPTGPTGVAVGLPTGGATGTVLTKASSTDYDTIWDLPGKILQVVRATDSTNRTTTSTSFVDVTGMSVTITPQKSTSKILVVSSFNCLSINSTDNNFRVMAQITDSSNNPLVGAEQATVGLRNITRSTTFAQFRSVSTIIGYDEPSTISATTYKVRFKINDPNCSFTIENDALTGQIFAIEVAA